MEPISALLKMHKLGLGLSADVLTFGGGLLLARDAFRHLVELRQEQIGAAFKARFPRLALRAADQTEEKAKLASKIAWRGLALLILGFVCEVLTRFAE